MVCDTGGAPSYSCQTPVLRRRKWQQHSCHGLAMVTAKFDIGGLAVAELLRKDYKQSTIAGVQFGIAGVGIHLRDFACKVSMAGVEAHGLLPGVDRTDSCLRMGQWSTCRGAC